VVFPGLDEGWPWIRCWNRGHAICSSDFCGCCYQRSGVGGDLGPPATTHDGSRRHCSSPRCGCRRRTGIADREIVACNYCPSRVDAIPALRVRAVEHIPRQRNGSMSSERPRWPRDLAPRGPHGMRSNRVWHELGRSIHKFQSTSTFTAARQPRRRPGGGLGKGDRAGGRKRNV
jgi:hypothetical protein